MSKFDRNFGTRRERKIEIKIKINIKCDSKLKLNLLEERLGGKHEF